MGNAPWEDRAGKLGLAAHGLVEADLYGLCGITRRRRPYSGPGARRREMARRTARRAWIRHRDDRYRFRSGPALQSAVSRPFLHAWQRPVRAPVPHQFGSAAAEGRGHHRGTAQDQAGIGQPIARSGAGAPIGGARGCVRAKQEDAMGHIFLGLAIFIGVLSVAASPRAQDHPTYGAELEGFDYPHDVSRYKFGSQGSDVSMAYMAVKPETANGRTAV